ncbi:hypothetical protein GWK18_04210 [Kocuria sp. JC486]|uniref:Uncharacterized protein n=1 Tax=Kocuria soli TaxID=2485125 RepID=A0A3N4ACC9_9MICC|nr:MULTISPECIES: hypothetical protein [Kocuria]NHU84804.1 hypothetical protein [Kocuria sp. JC486]ROZ63533.1 hypothetical protein EDL96_06260 [Kocuria soli]
MSKKRTKNARRGRKMSAAQQARQRNLHQGAGSGPRSGSESAAAPADGVAAARQRAMSSATHRSTGTGSATGENEHVPLFPPSKRPPADPNRTPWETYACMVMAALIVFLLPDVRNPENPWPHWFNVAPLAFGVLGGLFALLDKRRRLALISSAVGLVLFVVLMAVLATLGRL